MSPTSSPSARYFGQFLREQNDSHRGGRGDVRGWRHQHDRWHATITDSVINFNQVNFTEAGNWDAISIDGNPLLSAEQTNCVLVSDLIASRFPT